MAEGLFLRTFSAIDIFRMSGVLIAGDIPLEQMGPKLDEFVVSWKRHKQGSASNGAEIVLNRSTGLPTKATPAAGTVAAEGDLLWMRTLECCSKYGCTPTGAADKCAARLRIFVRWSARSKKPYADFYQFGSHGDNFVCPPASTRTHYTSKEHVTKVLAGEITTNTDDIAPWTAAALQDEAAAKKRLREQLRYAVKKQAAEKQAIADSATAAAATIAAVVTPVTAAVVLPIPTSAATRSAAQSVASRMSSKRARPIETSCE